MKTDPRAPYNHLLLAVPFIVALVLAGCAGLDATPTPQAEPPDWRSLWLVEDGFTVEIDSEGFEFPSAIAFVPEPGSSPDSPLYFVTELYGGIRVVTNDRTVHSFAEDFVALNDVGDSPGGRRGQSGLAGICLAPERGYVFATFAYQDETGVLRNSIIRFQSEPGTFSLRPSASVEFRELFLDFPIGPSHQIGPCRVDGDLLYVGVGDGYYRPSASRNLASPLGKVLRMTLDGEPAPGNPLATTPGGREPIDYVWSYGHRNPFSMNVLDGRVFVFENGPAIDRFEEILPGEDYLWDGTNDSMTLNADAVFSPAVGPVQMDYLGEGSRLFPSEYRGAFYVASSAERPGIVLLPYSLEERRFLERPRHVLRYAGDSSTQVVVGLAFGPDGLYFAPIMPTPGGESFIYRLTFDPSAEYPYSIDDEVSPAGLIQKYGCLGCHRLGGTGSRIAPSLDQGELVARLTQSLNSDGYLQSLAELDLLDTSPQSDYASARQEVVSAEGMDRIRTWIQYRLLQPRFDNTYAQMPVLDITPEEAEAIASFLVTPQETSGLERIVAVVRDRRSILLLSSGFGAGALGGIGLAILWKAINPGRWLGKRRARRQERRPQ